MQGKGILIIISGPSGVGKGTICAELRKHNSQICNSVSVTTRAPREGEVDGQHYFFVNMDEFERMAEQGKLLEHAYVHGNCYGTPRDYVVSRLEQGCDVLLEIDVQGSIQAMKAYEDAVSIFILPPSREELERRLVGRGTETPDKIALRLGNAQQELDMAHCYKYQVINDDLDAAVERVEAILAAERARTAAM